MNSYLKFLLAALKNPLQVSTVFQTGDTAVQHLIDEVPESPSGMVVELGVGTGAITQHLMAKLNLRDRYVGLELNEELIEFVRERFPDLRFEKDSAENLEKYLGGQPISAAISSLPWTLMPAQAVVQTLDAVQKNLSSDGMFATYLTVHVLMTPAGRRFQDQLKERFSSVSTTIIIENLPPAKIFIARK